MTIGTYSWTYGSGADAGSFVLDIQAPTAAEPGSFMLLAIVLMAGLWIGRKQIPARAARLYKERGLGTSLSRACLRHANRGRDARATARPSNGVSQGPFVALQLVNEAVKEP